MLVQDFQFQDSEGMRLLVSVLARILSAQNINGPAPICCWHAAVVVDRLASATQVILELEGNKSKLEVQLEETRVSSHTAETEATSVAQQAVLVAEKAEQQRSLSEVHRKRCEAAMDQLAVQAKAREEKFTNQLEAANLMLDCTNQVICKFQHTMGHIYALADPRGS